MKKIIPAIMMIILSGIFALNGIVYSETSGEAVSRPVLMHPSPGYTGPLPQGSYAAPIVQAAPSTGTATILVIMIDFPDQAGTETMADINTMMFGGTTGSLNHYYDEVSYGLLTLTGTVAAGGWYNSANNMVWWGADSGPYPNIDDANADIFELAREAVVAADADVDFSTYDTNGNNVMDPDELSLCIIHSGNGQDMAVGVPTDIWSHRWYIHGAGYAGHGGTALSDTVVDGVRISRHPGDDVGGYWMQSEFSPMGTFAHEFGHDLGLPDLYDTDYTSDGIGDWGLMGFGSWNGVPAGSSPAHPCAWCKIQLGWMTPTDIDPTLYYDDHSVPQIETNPTAYKLAYSATEYFLVENREQTGYDSALPGEGILIWHIDELMDTNENEAHKLVDLEEAHGGIQDLDFVFGDMGGSDDPYLSNPTGFTDTTDPNSKAYDGSSTGVRVTDISAAGTTMTVDFGLRPEPVADINGPYTDDECTPITFDASGSYDDDGTIVLYEWDWDGDGIYDESSTAPTITHHWGDDYSGVVGLRVTDNDSLTDTDITTVTIDNVPPTVDAGPDQTVNEGDTVSFSGSFTDPGTGDTHTIEWDFGDGSPTATGTLTPAHAYGDNGIYTVTLVVTDDDGGVGIDTLTVTVNNVAPTATIDSMTQPNPQFILPIVHTLTFTGSFTDPGWLDTHTATWDFGDGTVVPGTLTEENVEPDATGTTTADHVYSEPGTYTVILAITDDDGGVGIVTMEVIVVGAEEAKEIINEYIQSLPDEAFKGNPRQRRKAFNNMFSAIDDMLADEEWLGAIKHLRNNIRTKTDGFEDGSGPTKDWIVDQVVQEDICMKIDDLTAYLETLL